MKYAKSAAALAVALFSLTVQASSPRCENIFWTFETERLHLALARATILERAEIPAWAAREKTKLTPLAPALMENIQRERIATVVLGGSSVHALWPESHATAKLYFANGGPQNFHALTEVIVDAAMPLLKTLLNDASDARDIVLYVPAPGQVRADGQAIQLPGNFGKLGGQTYALPQWVHAELSRRAKFAGQPSLARVRVIVKNDSFPLSAQIGSSRAAGLKSRAKLIFAGTGLGESNIVREAHARFEDLPTEMGHLKLSRYPSLRTILPTEFLSAAEKHREIQKRDDIEFENLVAGGRRGDHLSGLLSILFKAQTPTHSADLALAQQLQEHGAFMLEDVTRAAREGGPIASKMIHEVIAAQAMVAGVMATEFGENPAGLKLNAAAVFEKGREVYVREDGALLSWSRDWPLAKASFRRGVESQLRENPEFIAKLRAAGLDPAQMHADDFVLKYGAQGAQIADPDLECLATLTRATFTSSK